MRALDGVHLAILPPPCFDMTDRQTHSRRQTGQTVVTGHHKLQVVSMIAIK